MDGFLKVERVMCVGVDKKDIDGNSYYYNLSFGNGKDILSTTCGKKGDGIEFGKLYNIGLNYINGKLKLADYEVIK